MKSLTRFTSGAEFGDVTKYMSHLALSEYGPYMTFEDADDNKLAAATDNYCLDALKVGQVFAGYGLLHSCEPVSAFYNKFFSVCLKNWK